MLPTITDSNISTSISFSTLTPSYSPSDANSYLTYSQASNTDGFVSSPGYYLVIALAVTLFCVTLGFCGFKYVFPVAKHLESDGIGMDTGMTIRGETRAGITGASIGIGIYDVASGNENGIDNNSSGVDNNSLFRIKSSTIVNNPTFGSDDIIDFDAGDEADFGSIFPERNREIHYDRSYFMNKPDKVQIEIHDSIEKNTFTMENNLLLRRPRGGAGTAARKSVMHRDDPIILCDMEANPETGIDLIFPLENEEFSFDQKTCFKSNAH